MMIVLNRSCTRGPRNDRGWNIAAILASVVTAAFHFWFFRYCIPVYTTKPLSERPGDQIFYGAGFLFLLTILVAVPMLPRFVYWGCAGVASVVMLLGVPLLGLMFAGAVYITYGGVVFIAAMHQLSRLKAKRLSAGAY